MVLALRLSLLAVDHLPGWIPPVSSGEEALAAVDDDRERLYYLLVGSGHTKGCKRFGFDTNGACRFRGALYYLGAERRSYLVFMLLCVVYLLLINRILCKSFDT